MTDQETIAKLREQLAKRIPTKESAVPAFNEFLGQLIVAFGGPDALAEEFYHNYKASKEGSQARVQLMLKMTELLLRNTQHFGAPKKTEEMSDQEMFNILSSYFGTKDNGQFVGTDHRDGGADDAAEEAERPGRGKGR